jgi:hypothetical protein
MDMRDTEALGNLEEFLRPLLGRMLFTWNSEIQKTVFTKFFQNASARQLVNPSNNLGHEPQVNICYGRNGAMKDNLSKGWSDK